MYFVCSFVCSYYFLLFFRLTPCSDACSWKPEVRFSLVCTFLFLRSESCGLFILPSDRTFLSCLYYSTRIYVLQLANCKKSTINFCLFRRNWALCAEKGLTAPKCCGIIIVLWCFGGISPLKHHGFFICFWFSRLFRLWLFAYCK